MSAVFKDVAVLNVGFAAAWYICTPCTKDHAPSRQHLSPGFLVSHPEV